MHRVPLAVLVSLALLGGTARAASPPSPWNGVNPFRCKLQEAGTGTKVPDPGADPYCVHFDKTHQNITQGGMADFLLKEPARVASATPKCFYFQSDHWRGSIVQSDGRTVVYEFYGHYFFNKATGDGGAWVTQFKVAGQTFDPTSLPGFPPGYGQYFGPGTGGVVTHDSVPADPSCAARAEKHPNAIYASSQSAIRCAPAGGIVDRRGVGPVSLGMRESRVRNELGAPSEVRRGFLHYCVNRGGQLLVGQPGDRSGTYGSSGDSPTVIVLTSSRSFRLGSRRTNVRVGTAARTFRRAFPRAIGVGKVGRLSVARIGNVLVLLGGGRVVALGAYDNHSVRGRSALLSYLQRAQ